MERRAFLLGLTALPVGLTSTPRTIRVARRELANALDPYASNQPIPSAFSWLYADGLVGLPAIGVSGLAQNLHVAGNDVFYRLRKGLQWHDGRALDAQTIVDATRRVQESVFASARPYTLIKRIDVLDALTFRVRCHTRDPHFAAIFFSPRGNPALPLIRAGSLPVGTGPFRFSHLRDGGAFAAFEGFAGGPRHLPRAQRLALEQFPDANSETLRVRTGESDVAFNVDPSTVANTNLRTFAQPLDESAIFANVRGKLRDVRLRRAVFSGIDVERIRATIYDQKNARPLSRHRYDPAAARTKLAELGTSTLELDYLALPGNPERVGIEMQQQLAQIGIRLDIRRVTTAMYFAENGPLRQGAFDLALCEYPYGVDPDQSDWTCATLAPHGANFSRLCDPQLDLDVEKYRTRQALERLWDDAVALPLMQDIEVVAWRPQFEGLRPELYGNAPIALGCANWHLP